MNIGKVQVVNRKNPASRDGLPLIHEEIEIGRPSVFGNPLAIKAGKSREVVIERYEAYLRNECKAGGELKENILKLASRVRAGENLALVCYCKPLSCHGDLLAKAIIGYASRPSEVN